MDLSLQKWAAVVAFLPVAFTTLASGGIIHVPGDQPTIQSGINVAIDGDTVLVSPGTYSGNIDLYGRRIVLGGVYLLTGDTSTISQTIVYGTSSSSTVTIANGEDSSCVLIGITICGGSGGIFCRNASPHLRNLIIRDNICTSMLHGGGGIYCENASPRIEDVSIVNNHCYYFGGGGLDCYNANPYVIDATISGNSSDQDGGGVCLRAGSRPRIETSVVANNLAHWFGGGIASYDSQPQFTDVTVTENDGMSWFGGAFYFNNSQAALKDLIITKNRVHQSVGVGTGGGGIFCENKSVLQLSGVTIALNIAYIAGGGIDLYDSSSRVVFDSIDRCNIYLNEAGVGNDIYSYESAFRVVVDTFTVMKPNNDMLFPIAQFSYDIWHGKVPQNRSDLYVSPQGSNEDVGDSPNHPLRTVAFAKSIVFGDSQRQATIHLAPGIYSRGTNGEHFELPIMSYVSIVGSGINETILEGDGEYGILFYDQTSCDTVRDLTIRKGGYGLGGAVFCRSSNVSLSNVIITECTSMEGGAIFISDGARITVENALFSNNTASMWGGVLNGYHASCDFINVTMSNNVAAQYGSAIYCQSTNVNLINSILWKDMREEVYCYEYDLPSVIRIVHCDVSGGRNGIRDNGNASVDWDSTSDFGVDPIFVDPLHSDFHLAAKSPCVNVGIDSINLMGITFRAPLEDIEHFPREDSVHEYPDLGAFECRVFSSIEGPKNDESIPCQTVLLQNYPNPFNPSTTIRYELPHVAHVTLRVYNTLGQEVTTLVNERREPGVHEVNFDGSGLASGVYLYRLQAGSFVQTCKLLLLK